MRTLNNNAKSRQQYNKTKTSLILCKQINKYLSRKRKKKNQNIIIGAASVHILFLKRLSNDYQTVETVSKQLRGEVLGGGAAETCILMRISVSISFITMPVKMLEKKKAKKIITVEIICKQNIFLKIAYFQGDNKS